MTTDIPPTPKYRDILFECGDGRSRGVPRLAMDGLDAVDPAGRRDLRGLRLTVLRPGGRAAHESGTLSGRFDGLTLVGLVVHTSRWEWVLRSLPRSSQSAAASADAPAVWLVADQHGPADRFVMPAGEDGLPDLDRHYANGGHYVTTWDSRFRSLLPFHGAVRVHDYRPT